MKSSTSDGPRFMSSLDDDTLKVTGWREEQLTQTRHIEGMMSMLRKFKKKKENRDYLRQEMQFVYGHKDSLIHRKSMYLPRSFYIIGTVVHE